MELRTEGQGARELSGSYTVCEYKTMSRLLQPKDGTKRQGRWTGRWREDFWQPRPGTKWAKGKDWPSIRGPFLTGSAIDCGRPLVSDLKQARLVWIAEHPLMGGRGGRRNAIDPRPANDFPRGADAQGGVAVADGRIYLYSAFPDDKKLRPDTDLMVVRGAPRTAAAKGQFDLALCIEARTGQSLWRRELASLESFATGKQGIGLTPCVHEGTVFVRGFRGLYALDAKDGRTFWSDAKLGPKTGSWSHDESPVVIGGTLLIKTAAATLTGLDPKTGKQLWSHPGVTGNNAIPSRMTFQGREIIVSAFGEYYATKGGRLVAIEPGPGKILAETDKICPNQNSLCVVGDMVMAKGELRAGSKSYSSHLAGYDLGADGFQRVWLADGTAHFAGRFITPLTHRGLAYVDDPEAGQFSCMDTANGRPVKQYPGNIDKLAGHTGGGHWAIASDDRIVTSGLLLFSAAPSFDLLGKPLRVSFAIGYCFPIQPALADGRLFIRLNDGLACYDLRQSTTEQGENR